MELLAPVGTVEHFITAMEAGADAVYVGAPKLNARNPAKNVSLDEIGAMIRFCRQRDKSLYVAVNSLIREADLPELLETLTCLEHLQPDALIVQDLGVIDLVHRFFPKLAIHASTLMLAHNRQSVEILAQLGCSRVVLARELTLTEIESVVKNSPVGIEIFVHGAMCFSYSGSCLFSSYLGGKSGLRGNCLQPCRRKFSQGSGKAGKGGRKKPGYLFSMNDLEGLDFVNDFKKIGVSALKIEGRLRSTNYVDHVVRAYRLVMDADGNSLETARNEAAEMIQSALGRKGSTGYFLTPKPKNAIASHHSGNIGTYLGRLESIQEIRGNRYATLQTKHRCSVGERLRLHFETSGERIAFTIKELVNVTRDTADNSKEENQRVSILLPPNLKQVKGKIEVYRVDVNKKNTAEYQNNVGEFLEKRTYLGDQKKLVKKSSRIYELITPDRNTAPPRNESEKKRKISKTAELWLRLDSVQTMYHKFEFPVDRFLINIDKRSLSETGRLRRYFGNKAGNIIWALPQVVHANAFAQLKREVSILIKSGFRSFQISHVSQLKLFDDKRITVFGDYTLNLLNSRAMTLAVDMGLSGIQFCIEADKSCVQRSLKNFHNLQMEKQYADRGKTKHQKVMTGCTVYGAPPLFISRIAADHLPYNRSIVSPKNENFIVQKKRGETYTRPHKPFSLLPFRKELEQCGMDYLVIDLSGIGSTKKELLDISKRLAGKPMPKLSTFNYSGVLA